MNTAAYSTHDLVGHFSLQMLRNTMKYNAVDHFPPLPADDVLFCNLCAVERREQ